MSQNSVDFSGDPTGDELLDDLLTPQQENFLTSHSGTSRPSYAQEGTEWLDKTSTPWILKRFDGSDDIIVGYINATTNTYTPAGIILDKVNATTAPTINDDDADGYSVGSKWVDVTNDRGYMCVDSSTGAAVWKEITGSLNGPGGSSVDNEIALFSGTTARNIKRATGTGYVKVISGVMQTPVATIPLTDLANQAAQSVLVNATGSSAPPDALTMAASTVLARLASGGVVAASVAQMKTLLGIGLSTSDRQSFTSSGTWSKPSGYDASAMVLLEAWGAGAGAGSGSSSGGTTTIGSLLAAYGGNNTTAMTGGDSGGIGATANNSGGEGKGGTGNSTAAVGRGKDGFFYGGGGGAIQSSGGALCPGGDSVYGGGGGGSTGGTSQYGGAGGNANSNGSAPGGGGGGSVAHATGSGGGGSYKWALVPLSSLGSTETITIGAGGTAGTGCGAGARGEARITVLA